MPKAKQTTKPPVKRKPGRPKLEIDWNYVGKMLEAGCFATGIAATIGVDESTLRKRCETDKKLSFSEYSQQKKAKGDELLRQVQYQTAVGYTDQNRVRHEPNTTMQIWLGKQRLGQTDKTEQHNTGEINVNHTGEIAFAKALTKIYDVDGDEIDRQTGEKGYLDSAGDNFS